MPSEITKKESEGSGRPKFDSKRFIFGIIFGIVILLSIFLLNKIEFFFISIILISLSIHELYDIFDLKEYRHFIITEILSIITGFSFVFLKPSYFIFILFFSVLVAGIKSIIFFKIDEGKTLFLDVFSIIYAGFFISFLSKIFNLREGRTLVLLLFILVWSADIFAYYGGRHLGRRPFFPSLSPKKTLEGALSGFFMAIAVAFAFRIFIKSYAAFPLSRFIILTAITVIFAIAGDLAESLIKRLGKKKDSGSLIPGHGGILDRIDGLILSAPVFYYLIIFLQVR